MARALGTSFTASMAVTIAPRSTLSAGASSAEEAPPVLAASELAASDDAAALLAAMPLLYPSRLLECRASAAENERLLVALRGRYQPLLFKKATQPGPLGSRWIFTDGLSAPAPMREMENALERVEK